MAILDIKQVLDVHRKITRPATVGLRQDGDVLRVTSSTSSGRVLRSLVKAPPAKVDAMVEFAAFAALARGSSDVTMEVRNERLFVACGRTKGDIPIDRHGDNPSIPKMTNGNKLPNAEVGWLCDNIPLVSLPDLDRTGLLSAECDGREWRLSCVDDVHGACAFGEGNARIKFSLIPPDAGALGAVLGLADEGSVTIGYSENLLLVSIGMHAIAIPSVDGRAKKRDDMVESGNELVARFGAAMLQEALVTLAPVASAKDAAPVTVQLRKNAIALSVASPVGSVETEVPAQAKPLEFRVSHALLSALAAKTFDSVDLLVRKEGTDITRITLQCAGDLYFVMLTSS